MPNIPTEAITAIATAIVGVAGLIFRKKRKTVQKRRKTKQVETYGNNPNINNQKTYNK